MRNKPLIRLSLLLTAVACCPMLLTRAQGQGFRGAIYKGSQKMEATLKRKHPPLVHIMGVAVSVRARSENAVNTPYASQLASELESELCSNDRRLKPEKVNPETIVSCNITRLDASGKFEIQKSQERHKTGERQKWNEKKKKYEMEPVYEDVIVSRNYKVVSGAMNVSYQVTNSKTGAIIDASNIPAVRNRTQYPDGNGAPSDDELKQGMMKEVVKQIVHRLTPTIEAVPVLLARGKLDDAGNLGKAGLWEKMLENLEDKMQPFKDPKDDAYRVYDIGLAYEALAYKSEDLAIAKKLLQKAVDNYLKALEMNPGEKYFREPQTRIEAAANQYNKLTTQQSAELAQVPPVGPGGPKPPPREISGSKGLPQAPPTPNKSLTNQGVIDLAKKGLDEAGLIATIKDASSVEFDLGAEALGVLLENRVTSKVIASMRAKQDAQRKKPASATRKKPVRKRSPQPVRRTEWPFGF